MNRKELLKTKKILEESNNPYSENLIHEIEEKMYQRTACNICGIDEFQMDMLSIDIDDGTTMYVCNDCRINILGYCECGFPLTYDDEFCKYCGMVVDEVE